ncbi:MAG: hypothetical protein H6744_06435 [Deltaproteobacteria bacterium]|nr:hypothetical protein [Deltaproteobacteria bacterium]
MLFALFGLAGLVACGPVGGGTGFGVVVPIDGDSSGSLDGSVSFDGEEGGELPGAPDAVGGDGSADGDVASPDDGAVAGDALADGDGPAASDDGGGNDADGADADGGGDGDGGGADDGGPLADHCSNGVQDEGETDRDCGGACGGCATGQFCSGHGDCLSATCIFGVCEKPACDDDLKNGQESDVDCGGKQCAPCPLGDACGDAQDCASGACEGGTCCTPNACGVCAESKVDGCDGVDNDCDGSTDEDATAAVAPLCDAQAGVCKGSTAACSGGAWACTSEIYAAWSGDYAATEWTCDDLDNDCDGQTDEGLQNACGGCGPPPVEVCGGLDEDCDGETDEGLMNPCGGCGPTPAEVCNGLDDDCDGATDEADDMVPGTTCGTQTGVCVGAMQVCQGAAGWSCEGVLEAHSTDYEPVEDACDGLDNDCNGETDEAKGCVACAAGPTPVPLWTPDGAVDTLEAGAVGIDPASGAVYVANRHNSTKLVTVVKAVYGEPVASYTFDVPDMTASIAPSLAVGEGVVYVAAIDIGWLQVATLDLDLKLLDVHQKPVNEDSGVTHIRGDGVVLGPGPAGTTGVAMGKFSSTGAWSTYASNPHNNGYVGDLAKVANGLALIPTGKLYGILRGVSATKTALRLWGTSGAIEIIVNDTGSMSHIATLADPAGALHSLWRRATPNEGQTHLEYRMSGGGEVAVTQYASVANLFLVGNTPHVIYVNTQENFYVEKPTSTGSWNTSGTYFMKGPTTGTVKHVWVGLDAHARQHVVWREDLTKDRTVIAVVCKDL